MRILIIEDNENHMAEAITAVKAAGHTAVTAADMAEADEFVASWEEKWVVGGVISDVHFPLDKSIKGYYGEGQDYSVPQPIGVAVALRCEARGVPFVLCTDGHHHANALQWVSALCLERRWAFVEGNPSGDIYTEAAPQKDWSKAVKELLAQMGS